MLFVFRTLNFFALGAIFLSPFWFFNNTLDRLLPRAPGVSMTLSPRADATTARMRDRFIATLSSLKKDIHADMCHRGDGAFCALTICAPPSPGGRCP